VDPAAEGCAHHHRDAEAAVAPVAHLRRLADDLVDGGKDEVLELDLGDRAQPVDGGADGDADDRRLRERGVDDTHLAELGVEPLGGLEDAALHANVLAHDDDPGVAAHLVAHPLADGLDVGLDGHRHSSP
jgi:hypothetical protein